MISLIIASINRSDFLINYIKCLEYQNFNGQLLIGDSSNKSHLNKLKKFINKKKFKFEIDHKAMPNHLPHQCINKLVKKIKYDYTMWICDDDLLLLRTVYKCVNFLKKNPEYSAAGGKVLFVHIKNKQLSAITDYALDDLKDKSSLIRLRNLSKNYQVVQYAISRTKEMKLRYNISDRKFDKGIGAELYPTFFLVAMGKIKFFDDLFCVRQNHERRIILTTIRKIINTENYKKSLRIFIKNISKYISKIEKKKIITIKKKLSEILDIYQNRVLQESGIIKKNETKITIIIFKKLLGSNYINLKYLFHRLLLIKDIKNMKKFLILEKFFTKK